MGTPPNPTCVGADRQAAVRVHHSPRGLRWCLPQGQVAFHWNDDTGIRHIPTDQPASDVRVTHFAYDLEPARSDPNIVFPVDRLNEMAANGIIGGLTPEALACMGGIYSARRAEEELAPAIVDAVAQMPTDIDLVLLVPV